MSIKTEFNKQLYNQYESTTLHISKDYEYNIYNAIASGNKASIDHAVDLYIKHANEDCRFTGTLSKDPLRNAQYHFAIFAAMASKTCVQRGLDIEKAYLLSDLYIQKMDEMTDPDEVNNLKQSLSYTLADLMRETDTKTVYSKHINKCIKYINDHLANDISVTAIATYLELSPTYLSKLFVKEMGVSLTSYIKNERLKAAADLLEYTDYSISQLSDHFHFASQSHFTNSFTKKYKISPKKYRDLCSSSKP